MPRLRTRIVALAVASLCLLGGAPAGAAETGVIEGKVLAGETDEPLSGVEVTLTSGTSEGEPTTDTVTTDARGRYRFEDLPTGDNYIYALDARYEGGLFPGRALTIPDDTAEQPVIDTTLRVWSTVTDPAVIVVARNDLFITQNTDGEISVIESYQVTNTSEGAYIGRGSAMESGDSEAPIPSLGFGLPAAAREESIQIIDSTLDLPELLRTDFGFGVTTAIPPGQFKITFSYSLPGVAASYDLSRRMLYPTLNFAIFASEGLEISTNRLDERSDVDVGGQTYREHSTDEPLDPGDSVQVVALADAGTPPGLIAGMVGVLVLITALGAYPLIRSRRGRTSKDTGRKPTRDELVRAIAELDLLRERAEISEEEWLKKRSDLKEELIRTGNAPR